MILTIIGAVVVIAGLVLAYRDRASLKADAVAAESTVGNIRQEISTEVKLLESALKGDEATLRSELAGSLTYLKKLL